MTFAPVRSRPLEFSGIDAVLASSTSKRHKSSTRMLLCERDGVFALVVWFGWPARPLTQLKALARTTLTDRD